MFNLSLSFRSQSAYKLSVGLRFAILMIQFQRKLQIIFDWDYQNMSDHRSHNRNIALGERNLRANDLTCSFQKGRKKWFGRSQLKVFKKLTIHFISKFLVWCDRWLALLAWIWYWGFRYLDALYCLETRHL